jgi:hypothetical protein
VDAADDTNGEREANEVFQRHCNKEQGEKGCALNERDETKLTKRSQDSMISASALGPRAPRIAAAFLTCGDLFAPSRAYGMLPPLLMRGGAEPAIGGRP